MSCATGWGLQGLVVSDYQPSWFVTMYNSSVRCITPVHFAADDLLLSEWTTTIGYDGWCVVVLESFGM
jgi:hypothetical protein